MRIVIDASVLNKLFINEFDTPQAKDFITFCLKNEVFLCGPDLIIKEMLGTALHYEIPFVLVLERFEVLQRAGFETFQPVNSTWLLAEKMAQTGNKKQGYPSLEYCLYHALALEMNGVFVTANKRHIAKTKAFGGACALENWQSIKGF